MVKAKSGGLAGWVMDAWQRTREKNSERELELVETLSLGGRKQLSLVICGGQKFLVGCSADSVTSIAPVNEAVVSKKSSWEAGL